MKAKKTSPKTKRRTTTKQAERAPLASVNNQPKSSVAKVSHTLNIDLADRLERFAFFQRVSESAVIEYALNHFFDQSDDEAELGEQLRSEGLGRRRRA
jgi:predicted transcriptional regulator